MVKAEQQDVKKHLSSESALSKQPMRGETVGP